MDYDGGSDEEEEQDGEKKKGTVVGFMFGNVDNRLRLEKEELDTKYKDLEQDAKEQLDQLGEGRLGMGDTVASTVG
eukprot:CAMPEP_0183798682 /NCGR_PEP_ID=MMETSP0803_2-20130417/19517_1 /TAXON_ID=195967 /ORGANISM="Crustomastix stigmata, Strain CCMP3273" /LENGTH=75 /DNA_ID=CAMNT_0026043371 /DNA_START=144 /DNA_END=367 /DNA_ORIENTATION=-